MPKTRSPHPRVRAALKRKNMIMDQRKLDAAKAVLGTATETDAVDAALDLVVFRAKLFAGLDRVAAAGGVAPRRRSRRAG